MAGDLREAHSLRCGICKVNLRLLSAFGSHSRSALDRTLDEINQSRSGDRLSAEKVSDHQRSAGSGYDILVKRGRKVDSCSRAGLCVSSSLYECRSGQIELLAVAGLFYVIYKILAQVLSSLNFRHRSVLLTGGADHAKQCGLFLGLLDLGCLCFDFCLELFTLGDSFGIVRLDALLKSDECVLFGFELFSQSHSFIPPLFLCMTEGYPSSDCFAQAPLPPHWPLLCPLRLPDPPLPQARPGLPG